ncbi:MAG: D-alanyl-D-alanine carboxypeptidase [Clostridia bacterium]|nr:D-alanyl-D-alanine carboxypeptidase [Clostridia bacterium]
MKRLLICFLALALLLPLALPCSAEAVSVSAKSAVLMDASTGQVLYQKNAFVRLPMASTTKIMTAIVALETCSLETEIEVAPKATGIEGSSIYLYPNERITMESLLYALLLESANDAATAIALAVSGSVEAFASEMNKKAAELGLCNTHFENPHGLDGKEHYTTAYDLAKLTAYALANPAFSKICSTYKKNIPLNGDEGVRVLVNHNKMLHLYEGAIGVKTGFTKKSGRCLVSAAEREGLRLIAVTLSAPNDWRDHTDLLDFGFSRYTRVICAEKQRYEVTLPVVGGTAQTVTAVNAEELAATLGKEHEEITCLVEAPHFLYAPICKGDAVGRLTFFCGKKEIASCDLVASEDVPRASRGGFLARVFSIFKK